MGADGEELKAAFRAAVGAHPQGVEAGPKALLEAVKAQDSKHGSCGIQKAKRLLQQLRAEMEEEKAAAAAAKKKGVAEAPAGNIDQCPGKHGLARFITDHDGYCCDGCRCYVPLGAPMWGCRACDWDVCEGRCHPKPEETLAELGACLDGLQGKVDAAVRHAALEEKPADLKTRLALLEVEVHKMEQRIDGATAARLAELSPVRITEDDARAQKKTLLSRSEGLLSQLDATFKELKHAAGREEVGLPERNSVGGG